VTPWNALALPLLVLWPAGAARALSSSCPGTPLVCVGSGAQTLVVAPGLPPHALVVVVAGERAEPSALFGSSARWCLASPRQRVATGCADAEGTAVVRLEGRPPQGLAGAVQVVWRDRLSGALGATSVARWPGQ
jgi:hypothetical protein